MHTVLYHSAYKPNPGLCHSVVYLVLQARVHPAHAGGPGVRWFQHNHRHIQVSSSIIIDTFRSVPASSSTHSGQFQHYHPTVLSNCLPNLLLLFCWYFSFPSCCSCHVVSSLELWEKPVFYQLDSQIVFQDGGCEIFIWYQTVKSAPVQSWTILLLLCHKYDNVVKVFKVIVIIPYEKPKKVKVYKSIYVGKAIYGMPKQISALNKMCFLRCKYCSSNSESLMT